MANTNELDYSRKVADGERLELIMRQVASRFKLDGNVLAEALLDLHERLKAVEGATEELTSSDRWKAFKTVQLAKPSPSASGDTVTAIDTVAQDENGELTATKKNIRQGTTSQTGIVQLSDATNSTSTALAATANAVKTAYDLAASKQEAVSTDTDSSDFSDATEIATGFGSNKIHLNVASRLWNYIKGKLGISSSGSATKFLNEQGEWATVTTPDVSGKADKVTGATAGDVATLDANGNLVDSGMTLGTSVPADAAFTDDKVAQMKADSSDTAYPLLMAGTTDPRGNATVARYVSGVTLNPSTNIITANISGNAATANTATTATSADTATTAARATVLANPRNIHVDLESNTGANFNGSANIMPGVRGVLPTIFGGTGYNTVDTAPTEGSNKMVTSGGVWNFSAPANLGILTGSSVNVTNTFDDFDRFAVLATSAVRLRTYWLSKKSGHVIEFYNLNDYEISVNVVIEIGQTVVFHRQAASDVTWTNSGSTTSAQTMCSLSYKGYCKFYVTYDSETDQFDIYQNSNFAYLTGNLTTSMIGNVGTSGNSDTMTGVIYHNDIICNHASGNYAINAERLIVGQTYRFQFLTQTGYTYLYNNGTTAISVYSGNSSFTLGSKARANIQASSNAIASHTVSVVRMSATQIYVIWGY